MRRSVIIGGFMLAASMAMPALGFGAVIQQGFEAFTTGTVSGQGNAATVGLWSASPVGNATVINNNAIAFAGDQFLEIKATGPVTSSASNSHNPVLPANDYNEVSVHLRLDKDTGTSGGLNFNLFGNSGGVYVVRSSFQTDGTVDSDTVNPGTEAATFSANTWYKVVYNLDYSNNTYRFRMINTTNSTTLIDTTKNFATNSTVTNLYQDQYVMDALDGGPKWQIDDITYQNEVPEPAGMGLILAGSVFALRRRRNR